MGVSRAELFTRLGVISPGPDLDAVTEQAYLLQEQKAHKTNLERPPGGRAFYASMFPGGTNEKRCARHALYSMIGAPDPEPIKPAGRAVIEIGKAVEKQIVWRWGQMGILLGGIKVPDKEYGYMNQLGFNDPDTWLSGYADAVLDLRPRWDSVLPVDIKSKSHEKVTQMRKGELSYDPDHYRQVQAYIFLCRKYHEYLGWNKLGLEPAKGAIIYYVSRDNPRFTKQFYVAYDEVFVNSGIARLTEWKAHFLADELPERDKKWKWTETPCKWCVDPESLVLKSDLTWVRAGSLAVGDELIGFDEETGNKNHSRYRRSLIEGIQIVDQPKVFISTSNGDTVCSSDHEFLTVKWGRKWKKACDLQPGDKIVFFGKPWWFLDNHDSGYLSGLFDGEGSLSGTSHLTVAQCPNEALDHAKHLLEKLEFEFGVQESANGKAALGKPCTRFRINGGLYERLRLLGTVRPPRLLSKAHQLWEGCSTWSKSTILAEVNVVAEIGSGPVIAMQTSTKTLISDGFLSHNCPLKKACKQDIKEDITCLSESNVVGLAKKMIPNYDIEKVRSEVMKRWHSTPIQP